MCQQSIVTALDGKMPKFLRLALLVIPACIAVPILQDDQFDFDFSHLGERVYTPVEVVKNQTVKILEQWFNEDGELSSYVQGDIYQPVLGKNAVKFKSKRWSDGVVPYKISDKFKPEEVQQIKKAFEMFHQQTCIRFVPRVDQPDYISIKAAQDGCWSTVGRVGGKQVVNLQKSCLRRIGTILHEMMHTLGFFHEHTRHDRDKYVRINFLNIKFTDVSNFVKESKDRTTTLGIGYDLGSVMHYSRTAFSWNGFSTIDPKVKFSGKMGQRSGFSDKDVQKIKKLYC